MGIFRRIRDYAREYQQRQAKARREGYRSYGAKRYAKEKAAGLHPPKPKQPPKPKRQPRSRAQWEAAAVDNIIRKMYGGTAPAGVRERLEQNVAGATDQELKKLARASASWVRAQASRDPEDFPPVGYDDDGEPVYRNPYWYH